MPLHRAKGEALLFALCDDRLQQIQDGSLRAERHLRRWPAEVAKFADRFQMRHERVERNKSIRLHRHAHPARTMAQDVAELLGQSRSLTRPHVHHCPRREGRAAAGGTAPPAAPLARHRRHSAPRSRPLVSRRAGHVSLSPRQRSRRSRRDYKITLVRVRVTCTAHILILIFEMCLRVSFFLSRQKKEFPVEKWGVGFHGFYNRCDAMG